MQITTAWLKPPIQSNGQDHLGIQQPPMRLVGSLLPGLTVSTNRVIYLSFHPWVLHHHPSTGLDLETALRRAECLLTLIAERHTRITETDESLHVVGLVGRNLLTPALQQGDKASIPLAALAARRTNDNTATTYFKHPLGALGQYYRGAHRELGLIVDEPHPVVTELGRALAETLEARIDSKKFFAIVKAGTLTNQDLDALALACPCQLLTNPPECKLFIDTLFARTEAPSDADLNRRHTLLLLLDLASKRPAQNDYHLENAFRAACMTGALDDGSPWTGSETTASARRAWGVYARNDHLSVATLGLFWFTLQLSDGHFEKPSFSTAALRHLVAASTTDHLGDIAKLPLSQAIAQRGSALPPSTQWTDPGHEVALADKVIDATRNTQLGEALTSAVDLLLALATRGLSDMPYAGLGFPHELLREYPLNLHSFAARLKARWSSLTVADWVADLAITWGIEPHLRVATKKLFDVGHDTFLVRRTDEGLSRPDIAPPLPDFTSSRLWQATRYLADLGLLDRDTDTITPAGRALLETANV